MKKFLTSIILVGAALAAPAATLTRGLEITADSANFYVSAPDSILPLTISRADEVDTINAAKDTIPFNDISYSVEDPFTVKSLSDSSEWKLSTRRSGLNNDVTVESRKFPVLLIVIIVVAALLVGGVVFWFLRIRKNGPAPLKITIDKELKSSTDGAKNSPLAIAVTEKSKARFTLPATIKFANETIDQQSVIDALYDLYYKNEKVTDGALKKCINSLKNTNGNPADQLIIPVVGLNENDVRAKVLKVKNKDSNLEVSYLPLPSVNEILAYISKPQEQMPQEDVAEEEETETETEPETNFEELAAALRSELERTKTDLKSAKKEIEILSAEKSKLESDQKKLKETINANNEEISQLNAEVSTRDTKIDELSAENSRLNKLNEEQQKNFRDFPSCKDYAAKVADTLACVANIQAAAHQIQSALDLKGSSASAEAAKALTIFDSTDRNTDAIVSLTINAKVLAATGFSLAGSELSNRLSSQNNPEKLIPDFQYYVFNLLRTTLSAALVLSDSIDHLPELAGIEADAIKPNDGLTTQLLDDIQTLGFTVDYVPLLSSSANFPDVEVINFDSNPKFPGETITSIAEYAINYGASANKTKVISNNI